MDLEQGLVSRSTSDWMDTRYRAYLAGNVTELQICGDMVQMYAGLHDEELRSAAARYFAEHIRPHIFSEVAALVAALRKLNVELWAVSSTNKWVINEAARDFGIPRSAFWLRRSKSPTESSPVSSSMSPPDRQKPWLCGASDFPIPTPSSATRSMTLRCSKSRLIPSLSTLRRVCLSNAQSADGATFVPARPSRLRNPIAGE